MPLEPIEPRRLYREIATQLRRLIDAGEYPLGSRLPTERELAHTLDVSRPTVREALIALEVEGRVRIRVGSGIYVMPHCRALARPAQWDEGPFEVLGARALLEGAVAQEAARDPSKQDVAKLDALLEKTRRGSNRQKGWLGFDRRFHVAIVSMLNNAVLTRTVQELLDQRNSPCFKALAYYMEDASGRADAHHEHQAIRDAIAARSPARARAAMINHLTLSQQRYSRDFGAPEGGARRIPLTRGPTPRGARTAQAAGADKSW